MRKIIFILLITIYLSSCNEVINNKLETNERKTTKVIVTEKIPGVNCNKLSTQYECEVNGSTTKVTEKIPGIDCKNLPSQYECEVNTN